AMRRETHPQANWAPCNRNAYTNRPSTFKPLSDAAAAALVTPEPETRPYNARSYSIAGSWYPSLNSYVPTAAQLRAFHSARLKDGATLVQFDPYLKYVDGLDGIPHPSTDDLIQWAAHKWGIPEDWLRAEFALESFWNGFMLGDKAAVRVSWYARYPRQARISGSPAVYTSMGITQVKWFPDGSVGAGTEPLRWESTAFNLDYQAAIVRFYYDNPAGARSSWGDSSYRPCEPWRSIGGWDEPYPWANTTQAAYVADVKERLRARVWTTPAFVHWIPATFPPGVKFRFRLR
ncbi:MAG: hypothetical protein ACRDL5_12205, partial [Solirubrobacteraceae bacterium]